MVLNQFSLKGKSGIVTGGGAGIGKAMAMGLAQAGADVMIAGRNLERLTAAAEEITLGGGGRAIPLQVDMREADSLQALVERAVDAFGAIDFLFNNAGTIHRAPVEDFPKDKWDEVIQVNLTAPFLLAQAAARVMIANDTKGKIVNTSSLIAVQGGKNVPAYAASKGGLTLLTKSMCNAWAERGICVNAIGPGWVKTELTEALREDKERYGQITSRIPMGRWAEPEEFAGVAVFLASDASNYINGQVIFVDGGWLAN